jgi:O-antigen ligase
MQTAILPRTHAAHARARRPRPAGPEPHGLGFGLFVVVNFILFVRPHNVVPGMEGLELYQYAILACLAISFPAVLEYAQPKTLEQRPIDMCVLLALPLICLSHLGGGRAEALFVDGFAYFKIVVYYFLFVSLVTTPARLRVFCGWLVLFACAVVILSVMDYHKVIRLPRSLNLYGLVNAEDETRMYGPGIFQDPNDVCVLITAATMLLLAPLGDKRGGTTRWLLWLPVLAVFAYGFYLTRSRGGLLALLAGIAVTAAMRWGWRRAVLICGLLAPALIAAVVMTREVDFGSQHDTGEARVQLWNEGMAMLRANPLFGVGMNRYHEQPETRQVAHNSYMHAFGELGFLGGVFFLGAAWLAVSGLCTLTSPLGPGGAVPRHILDPEMARLHPYVAGCVAAYAAGMFSLTLNYLVVTYTFLGMASMVIATARTAPPNTPVRFDLNLLMRLAMYGVLFLAGMFILIRLLLRV